MKAFNKWIVGTVSTAVFAAALSIVGRAAPSVNLSGYEFLLGTNCSIHNEPGTCGVEFGGWTGGGGPISGGWTTFPGNRRGLWAANISYIGTANFGETVQVAGGSYDVLFKNAKSISGTVTTGTVMWPASGSNDIGCGAGVATVTLALSGDASYFSGCLRDLPAGSVIPPKIWGTLQ